MLPQEFNSSLTALTKPVRMAPKRMPIFSIIATAFIVDILEDVHFHYERMDH